MPSDADWVSAVGFAVEYAWAAGEAVIVPYLVYIGLPLSTAVMVFAVNPIVAVAIQPYVGQICDERTYSRGALIGVFATTSALGISTIMFAKHLFPNWLLPLICFVAFGVLDVSHDVLLIPSRAWISDLGMRDSSMERYHARYSSAQNVGRLAALLLGCLPLKRMLETFGTHAPVEVVMLWTLLGSALLVIISSCFLAQRAPAYNANEAAGNEDSGSEPVNWNLAYRLFALHAAGWLGYCAVSFYWTALEGLSSQLYLLGIPLNGAVVGLVAHSLIACIVSEYCVAPLNERFGCETMYAASLAMNAASLFLAPNASGWWAVLLLIPQGVSYPIFLTNGQLLLLVALPATRAGLASTLTSTAIPTAQILCTVLASVCGAIPWVSALHAVFRVCAFLVSAGGVLALLTIPKLVNPEDTLTRKLSSTLGHSFYAHASDVAQSRPRTMVKSPSGYTLNGSMSLPGYGSV